MSLRHKTLAVAAAGAAVFAMAQPAMAAGSSYAAIYSGAGLTGAKSVVDTSAVGECVNLATPAKSAINYEAVDIEVFFNAGCQKGAPGQASDLYFGLGSLHWANFPYAAASYRVVPMGG